MEFIPNNQQQAAQTQQSGWGWNPLTDFAKATSAVGSFVDAHTKIGSFNPGLGAFAASAANMIPGLINSGLQVGGNVLTGHEAEAAHQLGQIGSGIVHGFGDTAMDLMTIGGLAPYTNAVEKDIQDWTGFKGNTLRQYATQPGQGLGGAVFNDAANIAMLADAGAGALGKADEVGKAAVEASRVEQMAKIKAVDERVPLTQVDQTAQVARDQHLAEQAQHVTDAGGDGQAFLDQVAARTKALDRIEQIRTGAGNLIQPWHAVRPFTLEAGRRLAPSETPAEAPVSPSEAPGPLVPENAPKPGDVHTVGETAPEPIPATVMTGPPPGDHPSNPTTAQTKGEAVSNWFTTAGQLENVPRAYASYLEHAKPTPAWVKTVVDRLPAPVVQLLGWMDAHSKKLDYQNMDRQQQRAVAIRAREIENRPEVKALFDKAAEVVKMHLPEVTPTVASNIVGQLVRAYVTHGTNLAENLEGVRAAVEEHMPGQGSLLVDSLLGYSVHIPDALNTPDFRQAIYQLAEPYKQLRLQASEAMRQSEFMGDKGLANADTEMVTLTKKERSDFNKAQHKLLKAAKLEAEDVPRQLAGLAKEQAWASDSAARAAEASKAAMETMVDAKTDFDRSRYIPDALNTPERVAAVGDEFVNRTMAGHGATYDPTSGRFIETGDQAYVVPALSDSVITMPVADFQATGSATLQHFMHAYQEALQLPHMGFSTWVDDNGMVHLDASQVLEGESSRDHAMTLAAVRGHQTIKDMATGADVEVPLDPNNSAYFVKTHRARDFRAKELRAIVEKSNLDQEGVDRGMAFFDRMAVMQHLLHPETYKTADAFYNKAVKWEFADRASTSAQALNEERDSTTFGLPREDVQRLNESKASYDRKERQKLLKVVEQINPTLGNAIWEYAKSKTTAGRMREEAATRATPESEALVEAVNASPPSTKPLWRGMFGSQRKMTFNEGDTINLPLGSTSESVPTADIFMGTSNKALKKVMLKIEPGARALNLAAVSPLEEFEQLVSGDFHVTKVDRNLTRGGNTFDLVHVVQDPNKLYEMRDKSPVGQFVPSTSLTGGVIRLFKDADLATLMHEGGHLLRALTSDDDLRQLEETYGVKGHNWTAPQEEAFVHDFLAQASTLPAMAKLKENLASIYGDFGANLHPEIDSFWQRTLTTPAPATRMPGFDLSTGERIIGAEGKSELGKSMKERLRQGTNMAEEETKQQQYGRGVKGQEAIDNFQQAAKQKRLADQAHQRAISHVEKLEEAIATRDVRAAKDATRLRGKGQAKLDNLWEKLNDPAERRVPAKWQPLTRAARDMAAAVEQHPELEPILAEFPKTFGGMVDYATQHGFDPAYMPDLTPQKVRSLIAGTAKLGNQGTREEGRMFTSGARKGRTGFLDRMGGADRSIEALVAGLNQVTQEQRTNQVVDWIDRVAARDIPTDANGRRLRTPPGWVEWDKTRRGMLGVEGVDGERTAVGEGTKMIPRTVDNAIREYSADAPTNPIYRGLKMATDPWRWLMLTANPGFYLKHFIGHIVLAGISGGVDLKAWSQAWESARNGYKDLPEVTGLNIAYAEDRTPGLVGYDRVQDALHHGGVLESARYTADKLHKVIATTDSFARAVAYFSKVDKGATAMEAAQYAMDAVIDYGNLSNTEKYWVRAVVPFYSFEKGVAKLLYRMPIDHPMAAALMLHLGQWQGDQAKDSNGNPLPERYQGVVDLPLLGPTDIQKFSPFKDISALTTPDGIIASLQYAVQDVVRAGTGLAAPGTKAKVKVDKYGRLVPDVSLASQLGASFSGGPQGQVIQGGPISHFLGLPTVSQSTLDKAGARNVLSQAELANADTATQQKAASSPVDSLALQQNLRQKLDAGVAPNVPTSLTGAQMFSKDQLQAAVQQAVTDQQARAKATRAANPKSHTSHRRTGRHSTRTRYKLRQGFAKPRKMKSF